MSTRVRSLYAVLAFALVAGLHALAAMDARRDPRGRGPTEQDITDVRSRYPGGV